MVFVVIDTITVETVLQQVTRTIPELRFMRKFMNISGIESSSYEDVTLKRFEGPINLRHEVLESEDFAFQISCITYPSLYTCLLEELLPGGHGLMVRGYLPVIHTLAKGIDICLGYR